MAPIESQLSRYGAVSKNLPFLAPSGRSFFVLNNTTTVPSWLSNFLNTFPNDLGGTPRVYSTIKLALAACTANRGDVIYVLPNHTENITNATDLNINVAGVRIQGLGEGNNRPTLSLTTATSAIITFSAANCTLDNVIVDGATGIDAIVSIFTVTAAGCTLSNSRIITANATGQALVGMLTTAAANQLSILNNFFDGTSDAGTTNVLQLVGGADMQIRGNTFIGAYTTSLGAINNITTGITQLVIDSNIIINLTASSTKCIVLVAGSIGIISNNRFGFNSGTAPITSAGAWWAANYGVNAPATLSVLI